jgi:hypothetical protein
MANEILVLEGRGNRAYEVCFLYPIGAPVQVNGANVVPTPAPTEGLIAQALAPAEVSALAAGTLAYEVIEFRKDEGLTNQQLLARVREMYGIGLTRFTAAYAERYAHAGARFNP